MNTAPAADSVTCQKLSVVCEKEMDIVRFSAIRGGQFATWAAYCKDVIGGKDSLGNAGLASSWKDMQDMVHPTLNTAFYANIDGKLRTRVFKTFEKKKREVKVQFRPHTRWVSNENKCYVGEHDPFIMPNCRLYRLGKVTPGVRTLDTRYEFAEGAQGDILSTLSRKGMLGGDAVPKGGPDAVSQTAKAPGGKAPVQLKDQVGKSTPRPEFTEPVSETSGVVFDGLPAQGTLMARKRTPTAAGAQPACAAEVDWSEPVKKGRVYGLDEFTEFFVAYPPAEAAKIKAKKVAAGNPGFGMAGAWDALAGESAEYGQTPAVTVDSEVTYHAQSAIRGAAPTVNFDLTGTVEAFAAKLTSAFAAIAAVALMYQ